MEGVLDWKTAQAKFPWDVTLLLGAGFGLAGAATVRIRESYWVIVGVMSSFSVEIRPIGLVRGATWWPQRR